MLPMIVTVNLAKGALSMSKNKVIVKRLNSIQNFGAIDVLCSDKTGTLTQDKVILERHIDLFGKEDKQVLKYAYLNSFYQTGLKNLLDIAILNHVEIKESHSIESKYSIIDEVPFDFSRKRMSVVVEEKEHNKHILICKGASEEIFGISSKGESEGKIFDLNTSHFDEAKEIVQDLHEDGFRVIAVGYKEMPLNKSAYSVLDESDLTIIGFVAFFDPPKETATEAISLLKQNGVSIKVLTGDNDIITKNVCIQVGIPVEKIVLGSEIDKLSDEELAEIAETSSVFAKLSPSHKERVIQALHSNNHVVGYLGDGINDALALKAADVGISVDTAVDIAKETADIILLEKSLLVLGEGVVEGRKIFRNIDKYIKMGASSSFGNIFSLLGASYFLPFLPMLPIQILINNLLYDISQTVITTDNVDKEYLKSPRQWNIGSIKRFMLFIGPVSSIFDYVTFFIMIYVFDAWTNPALFHTGWFVESLCTQTMVIHIIRTNKIPFLQSRASLPMILMTVIIISVGLLLPFSPFAGMLGFVALPKLFFVWLAGILILYLTLTQIVKVWLVEKYGVE
jgi:Mg2+-importing ATPase